MMQAVELRMYDGFLESLGKLTSNEQGRIRKAVRQISSNLRAQGLRSHKVGQFVSLSASDGLRIIAAKEPGGLVLAHVGHHDSANHWANERSPVRDNGGKVLTIIPSKSDFLNRTQVEAVAQEPGQVARRSYAALPEVVGDWLAGIDDESQLLEAISTLSPEWQSLALTAATEGETFGVPPSDIISVDDAYLEFALRFPTQRWRVFLHPKQKYLIEKPLGRNLLVKGGPGSGKTVTLVHRFVRFKNTCPDKPPLLVALNPPTRKALLEAYASLDSAPVGDLVLSVDDLPKNRGRLNKLFARYSTVLIDEGQDIPVALLSNLKTSLERKEQLPPLLIAYDPNQAVVQPSGYAFEQVRQFFDVVTLDYCYRSTHQIVQYNGRILEHLHKDYEGKDFQNHHHITATRDNEIANMIAALQGPEVTVDKVADSDRLKTVVARVHELRTEAGDDGIAVIVVAGNSDIKSIERDIQFQLGDNIPVLSSVKAKGLEFFRGVVVDCLNYDNAAQRQITQARYRLLSQLYVGATRFRDRLIVVTTQGSPFLKEN